VKSKIFVLATLLSALFTQRANAALALDATRYVYEGNSSAISVTVNNETEKGFGGQVWVDNIIEKDTRPTFIATPSFFKIKGEGRQVFRIMKVSDHMPQDKESVYWLNLQEIPPKNNGSGISMAIRTRVKLFYRPESLIKGRTNAEQNMTIEYLPGKQYLVNSTPYIFAISAIFDIKDKPLTLTKKDQDALAMFMPGDKVDVTGFTVKSVSALNDFGNLTTFILHEKDKKNISTQR
jgi:P pilus assembly chaperone PapD